MPRDFSDWDDTVYHHLAQARMDGAACGHAGPDWPDYRRATALWLRAKLIAGIAPERLLPVLAVMQSRCKNWTDGKGYDGDSGKEP